MKQVSIIIVNYNVQHFLDQCIQSIYKSKHNLDVEILVVDNNSVDASVQMVKDKYPNVRLIANNGNPGFAVANNQAINIAQGKYVLLLNPDTLLSEDTLEKCFNKAEEDQEIGAIGVKMLDGKGNFLPESKRGFPGFWTAFYKMSGLSNLFKKSPRFNKYHLGHLDKDSNHEIEVLSGAFMFIRKDVLDKIGLLDEQFFMYGEDIDLSYRILKDGYKNYYLSETSIIHFKGESTRKTSVSYTKHFYKAMAIFNSKHFSGQSFLMSKFVNIAIFFSGIISFFKSKIIPWLAPLIDGLIVFFTFFIVKTLWANYYFSDLEYYSAIPINLLCLIFSLIYVFVLFVNGNYDEKSGIPQLTKGWLFGGLFVFLTYSFLPEEFRFSRAIILISFGLLFLFLWLAKKMKNKFLFGDFNLTQSDERRILVVGATSSLKAINPQFQGSNKAFKMIGAVSPTSEYDNKFHLGGIDKINQIVDFEKPNEIVFCSGDLTNSLMFQTMADLGNKFAYRISSENNDTIIGSDSKNRSGVWYSAQINFNISNPEKERQKRLFDVFMSIIIIFVSPFVLLFSKNRKLILKNVFFVLIGMKTWVGYILPFNATALPTIARSVFSHRDFENHKDENTSSNESNFAYAKDYDVWKDFVTLLFNLLP